MSGNARAVPLVTPRRSTRRKSGAPASTTKRTTTARRTAGATSTRKVGRSTARRTVKRASASAAKGWTARVAESDNLESSFMSLDDDDVDVAPDANFESHFTDEIRKEDEDSSISPSGKAADENSGAGANMPRSPTLNERLKRAADSVRPSSHRRNKKRRKTSGPSSPVMNLDTSMFDSVDVSPQSDRSGRSSSATAPSAKKQINSQKKELEEEEERKSQARDFKDRGNEHYAEKDYELAEKMYTKAIELDPGNSVYYGNRAASKLMQSRYVDAIEDCNKSIELDPSYTRARVRAARASLALGDMDICKEHLGALVRQGKGHTEEVKEMLILFAEYEQLLEDSDLALSEENSEECERLTDRALQIAPGSRRIWICKQALKLLRLATSGKAPMVNKSELQGVRAELEGIISATQNPNDEEMLLAECYNYAKVLLYCALTTEAKILFGVCLKLRPQDGRTLRRVEQVREMETLLNKGVAAFSDGRNEEALETFDRALQLDAANKAFNGRMFFRRAAVNMALHRFRDAIADCNRSLMNLPLYHKARVRRAHAFMRLGDYKTAVEDLEKTYRKQPTAAIARELKSARAFLEKAQRKEEERKAKEEFDRKKKQQESADYFRSRRSTFAGQTKEDSTGTASSGSARFRQTNFFSSSNASSSSSSSRRRSGSNASGAGPRTRASSSGSGNSGANNQGTKREAEAPPQHNYNTRSSKKAERPQRRRSFEPETTSHYQVLGLAATATSAAVKKAYKQKALRYHPDKCKSPSAEARFKRVAEAYRVLKSPSTRRAYDAKQT
eukprot:CAMPEP_0171584562 /NCGR_PEP_ID=MMETSP0961-20121227/11473_1 /TAXON_ID=87120 /ORGANISM="Aurantiochytrium limacinum, Strain ATCCMYA-1381" /LENGTH=790 /DNA_ID=CAMNT_0012141985 /DNA_START=197 /DNA_END=2565 /DNA_ORIENTATION=-